MLNRLPADERRAQLVESALSIAERSGLAAVTVRGVADEAGVSLGVVHYCFDSKDELISAMGDALILQLTNSMNAAFSQVRNATELHGEDGLRELLHMGLSGMWPIIEATPDRQLLTYEITAQSLRQRATDSSDRGAAATQQYRLMTQEAVDFLGECAGIAGTEWTLPTEDLARTAIAVIDGLVLRWLVDRDGLATIAGLDELVHYLASKAMPAKASPATDDE
ncbi:MAG: TetR family transcriptional regulator [Rhodococcus sp.]|nr:TetR family transcriptional regulator [Rhodococcus sp. (in: high G+C Gram-positive bacteria)]